MATTHRSSAYTHAAWAALVLLLAVGCSRAKPPQALPADALPGRPLIPAPQPTPTGLLVLPPGLEPLATPAASGATYTVRPGDTLLAIAVEHGTTVEALARANGLADADALSVGQALTIPTDATGAWAEGDPPATRAPAPAAGGTHVVQAGETLAQLARVYSTTIDAWIAANPGLQDPEHLSVGQVLRVPSPESAIGGAPARTHTVRRGESLYGIAREYGVTVEDLVRANGLANPAQVAAGQVLAIP